ncbi:MAG: tRNA pseudouridine(38-40) synthase TruA [Candidatus Omnitrophota bacterium]|jgi:tRNA pseudouridine38-40 synthase
MRTVKLTVEYDGTDLNGWQIQKNHTCRTVQGDIESALTKIFTKHIPVRGAGRTDAGVHALGQVAHFKTSSLMPVSEILRALNGNLPRDISVINAEDVPASFHAQYGAISKLYRYQIFNRPIRPALERKFVWHYPYPLNLKAMKTAGEELLGRHDFRSFMASDPGRDHDRSGYDTHRTMCQVNIRKTGNLVSCDFEADGFLYKMVRNIVGTLVEIGSGRFEGGSMNALLKRRNRHWAGPTAPPQGLTLVCVNYDVKEFIDNK